ncbi:embryonal Fyn-associated substrate [Chelonoidis abingdonii]|uniref:embryonal Fyn-associated substrate n=1 Tax=Chelonoidis abingdonii TaxID=106734 RepID=UPI003F49A366
MSAQLARALFDNVAECPEELSFRRGDLMLVLQPEVPGLAGWHLCSLHGQQGIVPANRVHVLPKPGPPDLSPAPRKESASAALYNPPRGQRSSSAGQKEEQQEVYVVPPPTRPCPPPCDDIYKVPRATWRDRDPWKVPPSPEDAQLLQFYAGQCRTHYATLLAATEALLASAGANQPPGVFVPHGRFVLVTAHKLVFVGDTLARQGAALSYPSAPAARLLQERLAELSRRAQGFTSLLSTLAPS